MRQHTIAIVIAISLAAVPAAAERYELGLSGGANFLHSESVDALRGTDTQGVFRMHAAAVLPGVSILGNAAEVELAWEHGTAKGHSFQMLRTDLDVNSFTASLRLRRPLWRRISGYGRAGMSLAVADLDLRHGNSSARPLRDEDWALGTVAALGADLRLLDGGGPLRLGFRAELGYQLMSAFHFDASSSGDDGQLQIATLGADLGELDTSGPTMRLGLYGRF